MNPTPTISEAARRADLIKEILECAEAIHHNINHEKWSVPQDTLWVPTIHAHASVIKEDAAELAALDSAHPAPKEGGETRSCGEMSCEECDREKDILRSHLKTANELLGQLLNQADACAEFRKTFTPETREAARTHLNQQSK